MTSWYTPKSQLLPLVSSVVLATRPPVPPEGEDGRLVSAINFRPCIIYLCYPLNFIFS